MRRFRRSRRTHALLAAAAIMSALTAAVVSDAAQAASSRTTTTIWVDPARGSDARSGITRATALRTLDAAWRRIPASRTLTRPVRILVTAGTVTAAAAPNYWESRWGTAAAPISIVSVDGPGRAQLPSINMFDVRHLTLDGVAIRSPFDPFHCERCSYIRLLRSAFVGIGDLASDQGPQEGIKFNQSDHVTIADSYLAGATDNALDLVAVQHARVVRSTIAHASDWCAYAKGGSTDIVFDANHVHHCGTGGITLGQGTGLQFMQPPWTTYEVYGARVTNTVVNDVDGAALGVNGGYAVQLAHNTAFRTGMRDHLLEVVFGERSCDGQGEDDARCAALRAAGAWGPRAAGGDPVPIGNSQVAVVGNLFLNPEGVQSAYTHFAVYAPRDTDDSGGPATAVADDRLTITGNVIWNGPADHELGLGGDQGCMEDNLTCPPDVVRERNAVNTVVPDVALAAGVAPVPTGDVEAGSGAGEPLPTVVWDGDPAARGVPPVAMPTSVDRDRQGRLRATLPWRPGAYAGTAPTSLVRVTGLAELGSVTVRGGGVLRGTGGDLTVLRGDWIELRARATAGHRFVGWAGACTGQRGPTCLLPAKAATQTVVTRFA